MKVVVAAGGRFHAVRLAQELYKRRALYRFVSGSYGKEDEHALPAAAVKSIDSIKVIDQLIWRTRLASIIRPSSLYVLKDGWFNWRLDTALKKMEPFDIFVGWANYFLTSVERIRQKAKLIIVESGSCHIEEHERLIVEECGRLGLPVDHLHPANRHKILSEYVASDYIMTPSSFARSSFLHRGFPAAKILQIPCGMDVDFFWRKDALPQSFFRLIFVGQLQIGKGVHLLLEAWRQLKLPPAKAELLLVGNLQRDVRQLLTRQPLPPGARVQAGVSREELKKLYHSSSAFVLPSIQDGFGMVMGEAMASKLPVIASTNTGAPDLITPGHNGLLIPAGNVEALAHAILQLYQNPEWGSMLAQQGQERIKEYTWQRYGDEIFTTYQTLLEHHETRTSPGTTCWQVQP